MFDNHKNVSENENKKPRFKLKQKIIENFRKNLGDSTLNVKIRSYKDILGQLWK